MPTTEQLVDMTIRGEAIGLSCLRFFRHQQGARLVLFYQTTNLHIAALREVSIHVGSIRLLCQPIQS